MSIVPEKDPSKSLIWMSLSSETQSKIIRLADKFLDYRYEVDEYERKHLDDNSKFEQLQYSTTLSKNNLYREVLNNIGAYSNSIVTDIGENNPQKIFQAALLLSEELKKSDRKTPFFEEVTQFMEKANCIIDAAIQTAERNKYMPTKSL